MLQLAVQTQRSLLIDLFLGKLHRCVENHQKLFISSSGSFATVAQILVREAVEERAIIGRIALDLLTNTY